MYCIGSSLVNGLKSIPNLIIVANTEMLIFCEWPEITWVFIYKPSKQCGGPYKILRSQCLLVVEFHTQLIPTQLQSQLLMTSRTQLHPNNNMKVFF